MRVLVTGGTGHLGTRIVSELHRDGHEVCVLARRPRTDPDVDWVVGDLSTGDGIPDAVAGVDAIVHAATNSPAAQRGRFKLRDFVSSPADVDVDGTKALLAAAQTAGVKQFVHVSIVGLEAVKALPYARRKLAAEQLVRDARLPWSIVRATGFYWLLARMFADMVKRPMIALPAHALMAPVDSDEFARFVVDGVTGGAHGERDDFAGPQTSAMTELMAQYLAARGLDRRIRHAPLPRRIQAAITAGNTAADGRRGTITWAQWLERSVPVPAHDRGGAANRTS
ncbi:MAG TPA: NAD(P)H-binding protein [Solirubrobacteraceae bacterium]|jgi:uncharacterized protein YbjT (DUF2867 family)|nr:NAD(P)H-binding protein [Solirubrobacteraceae bacterium]